MKSYLDRVSFLLGPLDGLEVADFMGHPPLLLVPHPAAVVQGRDAFAFYVRAGAAACRGRLRNWYVYIESGPRQRYPAEMLVVSAKDLHE